MKAWFAALEPRERALVVLAAAVVLGAVLYLAVWEPVNQRVAALRESVERDQALVAWLHDIRPRVQTLRAAAQDREVQGLDRSLLAIVDETSRGNGLGEAVNRIQPDGDSGVRVWLEGADFDATVRWLFELRRTYGVHAESARFEAPARDGSVSARLNLSRGAP